MYFENALVLQGSTLMMRVENGLGRKENSTHFTLVGCGVLQGELKIILRVNEKDNSGTTQLTWS